MAYSFHICFQDIRLAIRFSKGQRSTTKLEWLGGFSTRTTSHETTTNVYKNWVQGTGHFAKYATIPNSKVGDPQVKDLQHGELVLPCIGKLAS